MSGPSSTSPEERRGNSEETLRKLERRIEEKKKEGQRVPWRGEGTIGVFEGVTVFNGGFLFAGTDIFGVEDSDLLLGVTKRPGWIVVEL